MDTNLLIFSFLFSIIGMGFFAYGRKNNAYFMVSGIILMVFPYFIEGLWPLIGMGLTAVIAPFMLNWWMPL